jgi:hypothetical protein
MIINDSSEVDVGKRIAVDDEKRAGIRPSTVAHPSTKLGVTLSLLKGQGVPNEVEGRDSGLGTRDPGFGMCEELKRASGSASGAEHRYFPRVADAHAQISAVAEESCEGMWQMMQVEHDIADTRRRQRTQDATDQRCPRDGERGFRANER